MNAESKHLIESHHGNAISCYLSALSQFYIVWMTRSRTLRKNQAKLQRQASYKNGMETPSNHMTPKSLFAYAINAVTSVIYRANVLSGVSDKSLTTD